MKVLTILLALVYGSFAAPLNPVCEDSSETRFLPSKKYFYQYVGTSSTGVVGSTDEKAEIRIEAMCQITTVTSCVYKLKVNEVRLLERSTPESPFTLSKGNKEFVHALEDKALTFTMTRGRIQNIKVSRSEPVYATNIKRGMLSALQLEFKNDVESTVDERDVSGDCKTRYTKMIKDGKEEVMKVKKLTECSNRSKMDTLMHPVFYTSTSTKRTLLNCTSSCHYKVSGRKHISSVECKETHLLRPFSYQSAGVMTNVTQKMVMKKVISSVGFSMDLRDDSSQTSDLRFDFNSKEQFIQRFQRDTTSIEKTLRDLVDNKPTKETSWVTAMMYTKLVFQMKRLDVQGITRIWRKVYDCAEERTFCRTEVERMKYQQMIIDSLSQCGTEPCVEVIIQRIRTNLDNDQSLTNHMKQLLSGLAWIRNPTESILNSFWTLFKEMKDRLPESTITLLGSLVRTHCDIYPMKCMRNKDVADISYYELPKVVQIARFFMDQLYEDTNQLSSGLCEATQETVDYKIYVLRAIGNSRYMEVSPAELVHCASKSNYKNISIVALQVLSDMKQNYETRKLLKRIYVNYKQDPEMRMMAYLAWMKTPSEDDIRTAVETLEGEINTQVGSLVWSHLTSMNVSVEPTSGASIGKSIKKVLKLTQKKLRYFNTTSKSTFWHKSMLNEKHNLGLSADGHVIYHPESLLPRSSHLNITMDVLGGAFPVFETSTRLEGLELIWDRLFGPTGHFPEGNITGIVKTKENNNGINKRSIGNEIDLDYLQDRVNMHKRTPSGLFSFKLLGNELALFTLKDLEWLEHEVPLLDWVDLLRDLKNGIDKTFTKNLLFLQDSYIISTSIGLPLKLSLNGTAVGSLHMIAKGDLLSLFWGSPNIKFKGIIKPSAAVSLCGRMSVNAIHSMVGIQLNTTMFTSTDFSGNVTYKKGEKFKFHYNVVEKPQEIFNMSTMLFKQINNKKMQIKGMRLRKTASVCTSSIVNSTKYIGFDLCSNISVPVSWDNMRNPFLPLTGPANFSIKLHRSDPKLTTYKLEINVVKLTEFSNKTCLDLSTPGATYERLLLMNLTTLKKKDQYHWNISVGDNVRNWTTLNFTKDKISKFFKLDVTYGNTSLRHMTTESQVYKQRKIITNTFLSHGPIVRPATVIFLNATLNYWSKEWKNGRMIFNLTHQPLNLTWQVKVVHNSPKNSTDVSSITKCLARRSPLLNHEMVINITHINKTTKSTKEQGLHLDLRLNGTKKLSIFGGKKVINMSGYKSSIYFTNSTLYNRRTLKSYTSSLNFTVVQNPLTKWSKMTLNVTYMNHSITLDTLIKNNTHKKSVCLKGTFINGTSWNKTDFETCVFYLNNTKVKNLILNLTSWNTTHKLNTTWLARPDLDTLLFNYTCLNDTLANFMVSYRKTRTTKFLFFNGKVGNWSFDLQHSYLNRRLMKGNNHVRSIFIIHKAKNRTEPYMTNNFKLIFSNSTTLKNILLRLTLWKRTRSDSKKQTQEKELWDVVNRTVTWDAMMIKKPKMVLNVSSLLQYQIIKQNPLKTTTFKQKMNHVLFWNKVNNIVNVSVDLLPNTPLGLNCSGNFNEGININANMNGSLLWKAFVSKKELSSKVVLWNRTVMLERRICKKSKSFFLNISTWNQVTKTAFKGSLSWYLNATTRKTSLNVTLVNTTLYFKAFSLKKSHFKLSFVRRNYSEFYKESTLEFRPEGKLYKEFNVTSLRRLWKKLNFMTFDIPKKILNITVSFTSKGKNLQKTGRHLKILLRNITRELSVWKFTKNNIRENLSNLSKHLLKVTSHSLPNITAKHSLYVKNNAVNVIKFWEDLTTAITDIRKSEISTKEIAEELILSLKNISNSFDKTRVIGNISEVLGNISLYTTLKNEKVYLKNLIDNMKMFFKDASMFITNASNSIGKWKIHNKLINNHLKETIPKLRRKVFYLVNETEKWITPFKKNLEILRNDVAFFNEYLISETYPSVHNQSKEFFNKIKVLLHDSSFAGGIMHPSWSKLSEMLNISIFNTTIHSLHKYLYSRQQPIQVTKDFHEFTKDKRLEKILNGFLDKALEMYNITVRLPSWYMNKTYDDAVYFTDLIVMILNDTVNVMTSNSNKNLPEIVALYINQSWNITKETWNMTKYLMEGVLNVSVPVHERWEKMKMNATELYWDTCHVMPWARPVIRLWNTTMFSLMKNYTPEVQLRRWIPRFVNVTLDNASSFTKEVNNRLTDEKLQTPRITTTFNNQVMKVLTIHSMNSRPHFTKSFFTVSDYYRNLAISIFNITMEPKKFLEDETNIKNTTRWINHFFKITSEAFDIAESIGNGTLVNNTINKVMEHSVKSCSQMMDFDVVNFTVQMFNKTMEKAFNTSKIPLYSTWKTMNKYYQKDSYELAMLFTPKNQTAFIINQRQYITFDKRSFRVPDFRKPGCRFLIARDFLDGHFTVLATKNSYIITTPEANIEIYKDGKIKANDVFSSKVITDLPVQFDNLYAVRDGPFIRVINEDRGFEFELEMEHFIFRASISGFYHNRTLGLLGTNNGEVSDDWRSPLGENRKRVDKFLNSWLLGGDDECLMMRRSTKMQCRRETSPRCEELLKSKDSPFKKCFNVVDPRVFLESCIKEVSSCETSEPVLKSHCSVSAAYVRACAKEGLSVSMPNDCVYCNKQTRYLASKREVDIVVISSEGTNMMNIAKRLPNLISRLQENKDINPRFGLVGFNGRPKAHWKGHTHTLSGRFFGSAIDFFKASKTFDFAPSYLETNVSDGYMGIHLATKYPFRPAAKKIFILVTDSPRVVDSRLTSDVISESMKKIRAKLIVIGDYHFKKRMYGGDTDGIRYYEKLKPVKHKTSERLPENDDYVKVIMKTGGAVFRVKKFEKDSTNKRFTEMVNKAVLKYSMGKKCFHCRCVADEVGKAKEVCKITGNFNCNRV